MKCHVGTPCFPSAGPGKPAEQEKELGEGSSNGENVLGVGISARPLPLCCQQGPGGVPAHLLPRVEELGIMSCPAGLGGPPLDLLVTLVLPNQPLGLFLWES